MRLVSALYSFLLSASFAFLLVESSFERVPFALGGTYNYLYTETEESAWGDYNGDGYLDLGITLYDNGPKALIFRNELGNASFTELPTSPTFNLTQVSGTSIVWGDYNGDKNLDLFVGGDWASRGPCRAALPSTLYQGDGTGNFFPVFQFGNFCGVAVAWGDFNNDGRSDIVTIGGFRISDGPFLPEAPDHLLAQATLWLNSGSTFEAAALPFFEYAGDGDLCAADYDGDGWLDLAYMGMYNNSSPAPVTVLLHNKASQTSPGFTIATSTFSQLGGGSCGWSDFDNDGDLDLLLSGFVGDNRPKTELWKNTGGGNFEEVINTGLPDLEYTAARWGDFDSDGLADLCMLGVANTSDYSTSQFHIVKNNGDSTFTVVYSDILGYTGSCAWGDLDNDGRLDVFVNADYGGSVIMKNINYTAGSPPPPPTNVAFSFSGGTLSVTWDAPSGVSGPLTYEVEVEGVMTAMSLSSGKRMVQLPGNAQNRKSLTLEGLSNSEIHFVQVQSIDAAFRGSTFAGASSDSTRLSSFLFDVISSLI